MRRGGRPRGFSSWADKDVVKLMDMWTLGYSAGLIGKELGFTRNKVIGKVHRLGLTRNGTAVYSFPRINKKFRKGALVPVKRGVKPTIKRLPPPPPAVAPPSLGLSLAETTAATCKFPYGDRAPYSFCGHPVLEDRPYCAAHWTLTHAPLIIMEAA